MKDWQRKLRFVDLNYTFEYDWLIEVSDNNLVSESVENRSFLRWLKTVSSTFEDLDFDVSL